MVRAGQVGIQVLHEKNNLNQLNHLNADARPILGSTQYILNTGPNRHEQATWMSSTCLACDVVIVLTV